MKDILVKSCNSEIYLYICAAKSHEGGGAQGRLGPSQAIMVLGWPIRHMNVSNKKLKYADGREKNKPGGCCQL